MSHCIECAGAGDQESPEINQSENDVQAGAAEDAVTKVPKEGELQYTNVGLLQMLTP